MRYVWTGLDKHILRKVHPYSSVAHYTGDSLSPSQRQLPRTTELKLGLSSWRRGSCLSWQCSCVPEWAWRRLNLVPGLATLYTPASAVSTQLSCPLGSTACHAIMSMVILCTESLLDSFDTHYKYGTWSTEAGLRYCERKAWGDMPCWM